jgi:hypothetical protein
METIEITFNVGDKVRIANTSSNYHGFTGEVKGMSNDILQVLMDKVAGVAVACKHPLYFRPNEVVKL